MPGHVPTERLGLTGGDAQEWKHQLRSSIHPLLFAAIYYVAGSIAWLLRLSPLTAADLLIAAPKTAQAVIAAIGDYYTWKLAGRVYGSDSHGAWATVRGKGESAHDTSGSNKALARVDRPEPLAMVLFHKNPVQLLGNYADRGCPISLALGVVSCWN